MITAAAEKSNWKLSASWILFPSPHSPPPHKSQITNPASAASAMDGDYNKPPKETLKKAADGLTKVWKPSKTVEPFYAGGKVCWHEYFRLN